MKRFFWKLFKSKNYVESEELTNLVYKCIDLIENCPNVTVSIRQYQININTSSSSIELWNENKFNAWLSRGSVNGRAFKDLSPSWDALYDFKVFLKKKGYDIYVTDEPLYGKIRIDDVKC